jgi:DNA replication licensing factor MCM6
LAAANPIGGRYDRRKTLRQNIAMTAPIMSRFDLFFVVLDECNESSDYNLSRHILNLHRHRDSAIVPPFSPDQVRRYIRYGRMLNPKMTREAADLLIEKYKQLRQSDMTGRGSSYRVTVRQLESMIRLSEALAKLHVDEHIQVRYVREAARLLKASIIRVESDAIELTDAATGAFAHHLTEAAQSSETESVQKLSLNYEDYLRISNMLVYQLRRQESEAEGSTDESPSLGMTKSDLAEWYLEQIESEIDSETTLMLRRRQVNAVIERLCKKDNVLVEIRDAAAMDVDGKLTGDVLVVVHPNYVLN